MKNNIFSIIITLFLSIQLRAQGFVEQITKVGDEESPFVVTLPDGGAMFASVGPSDIIFSRYSNNGVRLWTTEAGFPGAQEVITSLKFHRANVNGQNVDRILVSGRSGGNTGFFMSLFETGIATSPLQSSFTPLTFNLPGGGSVSNFAVLSNNSYVLVLAEVNSPTISFRRVDMNGLVLNGIDLNYNIQNNPGAYIYDLVEGVNPDEVVFVGAIKNGNGNDHDAVIGRYMIPSATVIFFNTPVSYTSGNVNATNGAFDRICRITVNNQLRFMVVGHISVINNGPTNNITITQFLPNLTVVPAVAPRLISLGGSLTTSRDESRHDLKSIPGTATVSFSGNADGLAFYASIDPATNLFNNIIQLDNALMPGQNGPGHFDFISPAMIWFGSRSINAANAEMIVGVKNTSTVPPCFSTPLMVAANFNINLTPLNSTPAQVRPILPVACLYSLPEVNSVLLCGNKGLDCEGEIIINRFNCYEYSFDFQSPNPISLFEWLIDGVSINDPQSRRRFTPGHHTICYRWVSLGLINPNAFRCCEKCIEIDIPEYTTSTVNKDLCDYGTPNPCLTIDVMDLYTGTGGVPQSVTINGTLITSNIQCLAAGTYNILYYNADGCILQEIILNITLKTGTTVYCGNNTPIVKECGDLIDLSDIASNLCNNCNLTGNETIGDWINTADNSVVSANLTVNGAGIYRRIIEDKVNCKRCVQTINIGVVRHQVVFNHIISAPCAELLNYQDIVSIINAALSSTSYSGKCGTFPTNWTVEEYLGTFNPMGPLPTLNNSFSLNQSTSNSETFTAGRFYILRAPCCDFVINFICNPGLIAPPIENVQVMKIEETIDSNQKVIKRIMMNPTDGKSNLSISPNPASKHFILKPNSEARSILNLQQVKLMNSAGAIVMEFENIKTYQPIEIGNLPSGVYSVQVHYNNGVETFKLVINNK